MRERAEAATDHVCPDWTRQAVRHIARNCEIECSHEGVPDPVHHDAAGEPNQWSRYDDAAHIASWHPAAARAVADWLDQVANDEPSWSYAHAATEANLAHAVAHAYLGAS